MKLGLGITRTPSREVPHQLNITPDTSIFIYTDEDYKGVSHSRNIALRNLYDDGCDYISICDDDLIYNRIGWLNDVVEVMHQAGLNYVCLPHTLDGTRKDICNKLEYWDSYIGAFYILSRRCVEEVGYFSTKFKGYGFEDVHYKYRLENQYGKCIIPKILPYLVGSQDVFHQNPTPSINNKSELIELNRPIFEQEINNGIIYYPYSTCR